MRSINRHLARESNASIHSQGKRRAIVIELDPNTPTLVGFRLKGMRTSYNLPIDWCYREAVRVELARRKAEKKKAKKMESDK